MAKMISLMIDDRPVSAPEGTLIVDAAKKVGVNIPVFCYHPKMEPVGMCRMCLVDVGRPVIDRATGQVQLNPDGTPRIQFGPKLETACTTPISEGMQVRTANEKVLAARKEVLEFILTSHPLDCPICDKGGECPLQNLTLGFGPSTSRFLYDEKMHLTKHVQLGELIWLDRERCIQCGRCVRFQEKIAGDPVIGFYHRGRSLEITTWSEPGFDSIFSGNTTDICPVGALTTSDFHFKARPWEMKSAASLCTHCPVGCNLTINVRREAAAGGKVVVKRVMPRQNEQVNEIWICDKGRFAHHFASSPERLSQPLVRRGDSLQPATWDEALSLAAEKLRSAGAGLATLASGRLTNEDLFNLHQLSAAQGGRSLLYSSMAGGDLTPLVGLGSQSNLSTLGKGSVVLVVAADLHEEAPLWWLRIKQAAERGAQVITLNARTTRLDAHAAFRLSCRYGEEASAVEAFLAAALNPAQDDSDLARAARAFASAENALVFCGGEGQDLSSSRALSLACAHLLVSTGHTGKPNNGLVMVWDRANTQGAWDMGFKPVDDLAGALSAAGAFYITAADPAGDDPALAQILAQRGEKALIVQELFLTETARLADVVFPVQSFIEREGSFTSGERRVQHFFEAIPPAKNTYTDYAVTSLLAERLGLSLERRAAWQVMARISKDVPGYAQVSYQSMGQVQEQYPLMDRHDLYYGGTSYENTQGMGVKLPALHENGAPLELPSLEKPAQPGSRAETLAEKTLLALPVVRLYDRGQTVVPSALLQLRLAKPEAHLHPRTAALFGLAGTENLRLTSADGGWSLGEVPVALDETAPEGVLLLPRSAGIPLRQPMWVRVTALPAAIPVIQ